MRVYEFIENAMYCICALMWVKSKDTNNENYCINQGMTYHGVVLANNVTQVSRGAKK
jgi:hypothetical protein